MWWQDCSKLISVIGLSLVSFSSFSSQIIYGLPKAEQISWNSATHNTAYIKQRPKKTAIATYIDKDGVLPPANPWFVGLGFGWMSPFDTNATHFATSGMPGFPNDRYDGHGSKSAGQYSILAGYQWQGNTEWLPAYSLALQYTYTDAAQINGFIYVNNFPDSKNFTYQYDVSQQLAMAKLKVDLYRWQRLMPYVSASAGAAFNRAHNYAAKPIPGATFMQRRDGFNDKTNTQFAGAIGVGLDYGISNQAQLSLGYELAYYGKAKTGNGQGILSPYHLGNNFNSNAVVLQGIYFFDWS